MMFKHTALNVDLQCIYTVYLLVIGGVNSLEQY